jgi:hypothetical protein
MFLIMVPAQFVGYLLGTLIAVISGAFLIPGGGLMINAAAAATAGLAVGLWTTPEPRSRPACAALSTVLGATVAMAVFLGAAARLATGHVPGPLDFAPGVIITALGQGLIGWLLWMIKRDSRTNSADV